MLQCQFGNVMVQAFRVNTKMMNVSVCGSAYTSVSICMSPQKNMAYKFFLTSPAVFLVLLYGL